VGEARPPAGSPGEPPPLDRPPSGTDPAASAVTEKPSAQDGRGSEEPRAASPPSGKHRRKEEQRRGFLGFIRELPGLILIAFALALLIKTFLVQAFFIPSGSMLPTLHIGDRVLVNKLVYTVGQPQRRDIIVFQNPKLPEPDRGFFGGIWNWLIEGLGVSSDPNRDFIKRVIGLPGDTVEVRHGRVFVNGDRLNEPYARDERDDSDYGPQTIPPGEYFVMGDNRPNSSDSRAGLGFIPEDKIVGKAFVLLWPPDRIEWLSDD
jgi:signal peptidase I